MCGIEVFNGIPVDEIGVKLNSICNELDYVKLSFLNEKANELSPKEIGELLSEFKRKDILSKIKEIKKYINI